MSGSSGYFFVSSKDLTAIYAKLRNLIPPPISLQQNSVFVLRSGVNNRSILDNGLEGCVQAYPILRQQIRERGFAEIMERSGRVERRERSNHGDRPMGSLFVIVAEMRHRALY